MVFDNNIIYNYMYRLLRHGIDVPVVAGIMPVTNAKQINRICELSGTKLPANYRAIVEKFADDPEALKQAGIAYATGQIVDLIANGLKKYSCLYDEPAGNHRRDHEKICRRS